MTPNCICTNAGNVIIFTCITAGNITWYHKNGPLPPNTVVKNDCGTLKNFLIVYNVDVQNSGSYQCIEKDLKKNIHYQAEGTVIVSGIKRV